MAADACHLSNTFSDMDQYYIRKNMDKKECLRTYKDMPVHPLELYKDPDYIMRKHGKDLQVVIDATVQNKRRRRKVELVKDSFDDQEEDIFK